MADTGSTPASIGEILSLTPPNVQRATQDATHMESHEGWMEAITEGVIDPGTWTFNVHHLDQSTGDSACWDALASGTQQDCEGTFKGESGAVKKWTFSAFVTNYNPQAQEIRGKQTAAITVRITGKITRSAVS
ncbi:MAG: hypothetical protein CMN73_04350 [Sphingomonas sp.]|nr:hypothetical protein [Sphingomonas sp.]